MLNYLSLQETREILCVVSLSMQNAAKTFNQCYPMIIEVMVYSSSTIDDKMAESVLVSVPV